MSRPPDNRPSGNQPSDNQPSDNRLTGQSQSGTWTDGGPTSGGPQDKSFAYRQSRKAFIEACEKAGADVIGRVHPARAPDGKPLFLDAAAFGPRLAHTGVLAVAYGAPGAAILQALLGSKAQEHLPPDTRLVLVHGADPAAFAWNDATREDPAWGERMLTAVVSEDLRQAATLHVIGLGGPALFQPRPAVAVTRTVASQTGAAKRAVLAAIAAAAR